MNLPQCNAYQGHSALITPPRLADTGSGQNTVWRNRKHPLDLTQKQQQPRQGPRPRRLSALLPARPGARTVLSAPGHPRWRLSTAPSILSPSRHPVPDLCSALCLSLECDGGAPSPKPDVLTGRSFLSPGPAGPRPRHLHSHRTLANWPQVTGVTSLSRAEGGPARSMEPGTWM